MIAPRTVRVVAGLLERGGEVLVTLRPLAGPDGGLWEFPGGKVELGESDEEALARELLEELGVEVEVGPRFARSSHRRGDLLLEMHTYRCQIRRGALQCLQVDDLRWLRPEALGGLDFPPLEQPVLARLLREPSIRCPGSELG